ncbi:MAG: hypothetical protein JW969_06630, partial [Spirochaetales bacterium]|nr:hypothetical protein [Spirochaetales bacterium]
KLNKFAKTGQFHHVKINSKVYRNKQNRLFPVNYMDRELRKDLAAYRRETVCFARNVSAAMGRLSVYLYYHNYLKPYRINNRKDNLLTHAFIAGIKNTGIPETMNNRLFTERCFLTHCSLERFEEDIWMKRLVTPLKRRKEYVPAYYAA